ncbi:MAG: class I SAM-dependent methyltransferase [Oscillospiraceae bacterium]
MSYRNIGSRLMMAASLVCGGKTVCDVGCDHGKLSLYLVKEGRAQRIIATDINRQPLDKAIELFKKNDMEAVGEFFLTDGLQDIGDTQDITHVVIAGLGGETMGQIIEAAPFIKTQRVQLVLVPAQSAPRLRRYLFENGFSITGEHTVEEKKKYYTAITALYTGEKRCPTLYDCYIGNSEQCEGESAAGYFEMVLSQLRKKQKGQEIERGECSEELRFAIEKVQALAEK